MKKRIGKKEKKPLHTMENKRRKNKNPPDPGERK